MLRWDVDIQRVCEWVVLVLLLVVWGVCGCEGGVGG
jgi:hypothetical protein